MQFVRAGDPIQELPLLTFVAQDLEAASSSSVVTPSMNSIVNRGSVKTLPPSLSIRPGLVLVQFSDRLKGAVIDAALVGLALASMVAASAFVADRFAEGSLELVLLSVMVVVPWIYFAGLESAPTQGTVGMLFSNARVSTLDGQRIGFVRASLRFVVMLLTVLVLPAIVISLLIALRFERGQAIHDMVARTLVVRRGIPIDSD
jgi:uncharacterized RDD family membrane protein YckC